MVNLSADLIRDLAVRRPGTPVLSLYARTDPRDPANTAAVPGWLVEVRNGLREVSRQAEQEPRDRRLALRQLRDQAEQDILDLDPAGRGRGQAWFLTPDRALDLRLSLQLPPASTLVRWDDLPYVSPLVDVADRGRPAGLVLVSTEAVRLLHWQDGMVTEPQRSLYEIEPGEWRDYDAYVGHPGRAPARMHVAEFDQRLEEWRQRFLRTAARSVAADLEQRGWDQMVLAGEPPVAAAFRDQLPDPLARKVIAVVEANLLREETTVVADRLGAALDRARIGAGKALLEQAIDHALAGGAAAIGWPEVMDSLVQQRVRHLLLDPAADPDPAQLDPNTQAALGWPARPMLAERAVEQAVASGAEVTTLPADTPELAHAGGAAALLRY
ncbi:MAG TPA: VLRF1 family aeRF1-type release factor [Streptosporangiaceae bacterium]|nr:VLRF1 family aeRF1-type release factor [Streptosporangiaceae bacterium]